MAKAQARLTRRQLARREREERAQRILTWAAVMVVAVIVFIISYGVTSEVFVRAPRPVAIVGDDKITTREFQARQDYERRLRRLEIAQYQAYLQQIDTTDPNNASLVQQLQMTINNLENQLSSDLSTTTASQMLETMIEEELLRQEAEARDIALTKEEIDQGVELAMGFDREAVSQGITQTTSIGSEAEYREVYDSFRANVLQASRFSTDDFRAIVEADLIRERIKESLADEMDTLQEQVETIFFVAGSEEQAQAYTERLNEEGEDPQILVAELLEDEDDTTVAYEFPWLPVGYLGGQFNMELEKAAFATPVGQAADPILGPGERYFVVYVTGHETRELEGNILTQKLETAYDEWLGQQKAEKVEYLNWEAAVVTE